MLRHLVWTASARRDLRGITDYITDRSAPAAIRLENLILDGAKLLPLHPFIYRAGRQPDTREFVVHPNYIIVYQVKDDRVRILRILHARQRYP